MKKYIENRPWGKFEQFTHNEKSTVKIISVKPRQKLSLQYHKKRTEFWRFLDNEAKVTINKKTIKVKAGSEVIIKKGTLHTVEALKKPVRFLEIAEGNFDENDIIRIEDKYGRV